MEIQNKVAIVTGASSGIGLATAKLLVSNGAKVALVSRNKSKLDELSKHLPNSLSVPADMTKIEQIKAMVTKTESHFGKINILINNAGQGYDATIEQIDVNVFNYIFTLDVLGPVIAMQQVIPSMRKQGEGAIVNISSGLALMYLPGMSAYGSLKRGLAHISLTAREELRCDNISVSVMYPYITLTDFEKNTIRAKSSEVEWPQGSDEDESGGVPYPPDTAEYVAQKIIEGIASGNAEIFAHDWMKNMGRQE